MNAHDEIHTLQKVVNNLIKIKHKAMDICRSGESRAVDIRVLAGDTINLIVEIGDKIDKNDIINFKEIIQNPRDLHKGNL